MFFNVKHLGFIFQMLMIVYLIKVCLSVLKTMKFYNYFFNFIINVIQVNIFLKKKKNYNTNNRKYIIDTDTAIKIKAVCNLLF